MQEIINSQVSKKQPLKEISILKKSNVLISSKYNSSVLENKLLALGLLKAKNEEGRIVSKISTKELKHFLNEKERVNGSFYTQIKEAADEMMDRKILIEDKENNRFIIMALIGVVKYENNILEIKFEPDMTNYILDVKSNYTNFNIPILMSFKRTYSYRLYEILKSGLYDKNKNFSNKEKDEYILSFTVPELKLSIGVVDTTEKEVKQELRKGKLDIATIVNDVSKNKKFESWSNFKFCVLDPAVSEINQKSDISVSYILDRNGNGGKVTGIEFSVIYKPKAKTLPENIKKEILSENERENLINKVLSLIEEPITRENAILFLKCSGWNISIIEEVYELASKQEEIQNLVGWMISAINNKYKTEKLHKVQGYSYQETKELDEQFEKIFS